MAVEQTAQRGGADQRIVGIEHRDLAVAKMLDRLQRGVSGAQTFLLHNTNVWFGFFSNRIHVGTQDNNDAIEYRLAACQQMAQHGPAGQAMQRLRQRRFHPGAQAGGQDDCGCLHTRPLLRSCDWRSGDAGAMSKATVMLLVQFTFRSAT